MRVKCGVIALMLALLLVSSVFAGDNNNGNGQQNPPGQDKDPKCDAKLKVTFCHIDAETGPETITIDECGYLNGHNSHTADGPRGIPCEICGDGLIVGTEECDGTNGTQPHHTCTGQCKLQYVPYCGDSIVNQNSEQCDDGNSIQTDTCSNSCTYSRNVCASQSTTVVDEGTATWAFWDESSTPGIGQFVNGPATPPAGSGSAKLIVSAAAGSRKLLSTDSFRGTKLREITTLKYSTYNDASAQDGVTATLQFDIDTDASDANTAWQGRLVYEPLYSHIVSEGAWQEWDTLDDAQPGSWWFSGAPGSNVCPQANPCTWSEVLAAFPNAAIRDKGTVNSGLTHLKAGGPSDVNANVDKLVLGIKNTCRTYDFEHKTVCGDGAVDQNSEQCDNGNNNGIACSPGEASCQYCSTICTTVTLQSSAATETLYNASSAKGTPDKAHAKIGAGAWKSNGVKFELYIPSADLFGKNVKLSEIESITYATYKDTTQAGNNYYIQLYTDKTDCTGASGSWYCSRLTLDPLYSKSINDATGTWNTWSTKAGTNQLTVYDQPRSGWYGWYYPPTFQELQAGSINWNAYGAPNSVTRDYREESVAAFSIQTGSGWAPTFDGSVDELRIVLKNGTIMVVDLEPPVCGNNIIEAGETCDGAVAAGYACNSCQLTKLPVQGLTLTSMCLNKDNSALLRVRNPNTFPVNFTWERYANLESGSGTATASADTFFNTSAGGTIKVFWQDESGAVRSTTKATNTQACEAPTPVCEQNVSIVSDTMDIVNGSNAVPTFTHSAWSASIPGATWIWSSQYVEHPNETEVRSFQKNITIPAKVVKATLDIATDNEYKVYINGVTAASSTDGDNFKAETQDKHDVTSLLHSGVNTLVVEVKNQEWPTQDPTVNPAGLLYNLTVLQDTCAGPQPWCGDGAKNGNEQCEGDQGLSAGQQCTNACTIEHVCTPGAELLVNGDFESPTVESSELWGLFPASGLGWSIEWTAAPHSEPTPLLELQRGVNSWVAHNGAQHAELDSNAPTMIYQDIATVPGQNYTVSFSFSARPDTAADDNKVELRINGAYVDQIGRAGAGSTSWTRHTHTFTATGTTTRIALADMGVANSLGSFVDNASVTCTPGPLPVCGDGIINRDAEECDLSAGAKEHYTCTNACKLQYVPYCGDGIINQEREQCDLTNGTTDQYTCTSQCVLEKTCQDTVDLRAPYAATSVKDFAQGKTYNGQAIKSVRSNPSSGLALQTGRNEANFFSLGFGGMIVVEFGKPIANGAGNDVRIYEDTWGGPYPREAAQVYASQDGESWTLLGVSENSNPSQDQTYDDFDLGTLASARYLKLVDVSVKSDFDSYASRNEADGFDLNAVLSLQDHTSCVELTCEQAISQGLLYATIEEGSAIVHNKAQVPFTVSTASYKMYAATTEDQTLHDSATMRIVGGGSETLRVAVPACAYQLDVVCGEPKTPPLYGASVINFTFSGGAFCKPTQNGDVSLSVAPDYPKGGNYTFLCNAAGFVPTKYYWYYGDGQILPNTTLASTYHAYALGNYTVACTATDGVHTGTGVLDIVIVPAVCQPNASVRIASDETTIVLESGMNATRAWQPYDSDGNTYWDSTIDHDFQSASWIWQSNRPISPTAGELWQFKRTFTLNGTPVSGKLFATADNSYEIWVNGQYVGGGQASGDWKNSDFSEAFVHTAGWQSVENYDVSGKLVRGENTILVIAANERMDEADGQPQGTVDNNPAGIIFELDVDVTDACSQQPEEPVCEERSITIDAVEPVVAGSSFTVRGSATSSSVIVNSNVVSALLGSWAINLTAPQSAGTYTVTATALGGCDEASAAINVSVTPLQEQVANETQLLYASGGSGGCAWGWHKVGDHCEKNPEPQTSGSEGSEGNDVFFETTDDYPSSDDAPMSKEITELKHPADRGDLLTGNVTGAGLGASWMWLVVLGALIAAGLGGYAYMKWK